MRNNSEVSGWIFFVGALGRAKGFPAVRVGLGSAFPSFRLDLESVAFAWFSSGGPANGVGILMKIFSFGKTRRKWLMRRLLVIYVMWTRLMFSFFPISGAVIVGGAVNNDILLNTMNTCCF
jgi:hypothetical protein